MERRSDDPEERLLASRDLGRAKRTMQAVRSLYVASAILAGLLLVILLLAKAGPIYLVVYGAVFLLAVYGIRGVWSEPFLWTLGAAAWWTLVALSHIVLGTARDAGMWFFMVCAWALGCWAMLPTTLRVRELLRKHPDLRASRQIRSRGKRR